MIRKRRETPVQYFMPRWFLVLATVTLYVLHQDWWFWTSARPLVFGFLPVGLFYHTVYSLAVVALMWVLVRDAWPSHLEPKAGVAVGPPGADRPQAGGDH